MLYYSTSLKKHVRICHPIIFANLKLLFHVINDDSTISKNLPKEVSRIKDNDKLELREGEESVKEEEKLEEDKQMISDVISMLDKNNIMQIKESNVKLISSIRMFIHLLQTVMPFKHL
jgi:hypothetical protein